MPSPHISQALAVYTKGTKAWFPDEEEGWVSATLQTSDVNDTSVKLVFVNDDDGNREHVFQSSVADLEKDKGASLPPLRNPPKMECAEDLTNLSHLNEPSVLHTIRARYMQRLIYTYSGIVLIATNPFDRVSLYDPEIIQKYSGRRRGELEPHLFAIAEDAYRCMIREKSNQTIIVSGESGAGKTVSAKYIMRYFATADDKETVGKAKHSDGAMTEVEEQILATNPIMEAFGNAKTTRNDNSSRFGKYIEIQFDSRCNIVGAKIRTYLLERSRLIFQPPTERNYHIFYQLCKGASAEEREKFGLREWSEFHYLNQGGTGEINGVDDVAELAITKTSLSKVGISEDTQQQIFRLLAALLHLGNIEIGGRTDAMLAEDDPSLQLATKLLGINSNEFKKWIVRKQIITRSEKIMTNLSPTQAQVVKDSMAKFIYANLFDWLVGIVNNSLSCSDERGGVATFIGVLDIYGFEHFKKNSFEQFCINYANEKLQQQFNQHVFKLEQEEYVRENIDWTFIEFSDNQKCIEMIEAKIGILSLLDEESRLPSGSDQGFCNKLYSNFGSSDYQDYFKKPRFSNAAFTVVHYAHDVQYEAEGFLEKNKDSVPDEHLTLLQNSEFSFLADMIQRSETIGSTPSPANGGNDSYRKSNLAMAKKPTLGSMFKLSLINLMDTIAKTNVHYIRCIKPNEAKVAWGFEPNMVLAQLRACGVLETIRISCSGYPSRWTFEEFADRYYALVDAKYWYPKKDQDVRKLCIAIVDKHIKDTDKYQFGLTKIFFRAGQLAYLEKLRTDRWTEIAIVLQKNARRYLARQKYLKMIQFVTRLQQVARQKVAKQRLEDLRREKAALIIQKYWRRCLIRRWYLNQLRVITQLQAASRALIARKRFSMIREHNAATQIQRIVRGWAARKQYRAQLNHIVRLQTCIRGRNARKQLVVMRAEARSVSHFKEVSYKLENRVVELAQTLTQQKEEKARLKDKAADLEAQVRSWIAKYDQLDEKAKSLEDLVGKRSDQTSFQRKRDDLRSDYMQSFNKIKLQDKEIARLTDELSRQKQELSMIRQNSSEIADKPLEETDMAELKSQIAALKSQLSQTLSKTRRSAKDTTNNKNNTNRHHLRKGSSNNRRHSSSHQGDATKPAIQSDHPLYEFLQDNKLLHEDVLNGLILSQTPTEPSSGSSSTQKPRKDIVYPAHLIGLCVIQLVKKGCLAEAQRWLFASTETMEKHCLSFKGQDASVPSAHWLVNAHELLSILSTSEISLEKELESSDDWHAISGFLAEAKHEILTTEENIYGHWMTETKRQLQRLIVPAIIENQSLPGFIANGSNSSSSSSSNNNNNNSSSGQAPKSVVDELLGVLSETADLVQTYMMDNFVLEQVVNELLKFIGAVAFNELIMRRNFNSWKRGMQIQCNITRLEDWCKERGMSDATIQLEHLVQATKLLQLKKSTAEDIKIIADVCWTLTPAQIHKLLQSYSPAEYEEPLSHEVLRTVASRIGTKKDVLITPSSVDEPVFFDIPVPQTSSVVDTYIPASVHVERLERFIKALC